MCLHELCHSTQAFETQVTRKLENETHRAEKEDEAKHMEKRERVRAQDMTTGGASTPRDPILRRVKGGGSGE